MPAKTKRRGWKKKNKQKPFKSELSFVNWNERIWENLLTKPIGFFTGFRTIEHNGEEK